MVVCDAAPVGCWLLSRGFWHPCDGTYILQGRVCVNDMAWEPPEGGRGINDRGEKTVGGLQAS